MEGLKWRYALCLYVVDIYLFCALLSSPSRKRMRTCAALPVGVTQASSSLGLLMHDEGRPHDLVYAYRQSTSDTRRRWELRVDVYTAVRAFRSTAPSVCRMLLCRCADAMLCVCHTVNRASHCSPWPTAGDSLAMDEASEVLCLEAKLPRGEDHKVFGQDTRACCVHTDAHRGLLNAGGEILPHTQPIRRAPPGPDFPTLTSCRPI